MNTNIHMAIINQTRRPCGSPLIKQGFFEFKESFYSEFTCTDHTLTPTDSLLPHVPGQGATTVADTNEIIRVSIHAPAWGATP